MRSDFTKGFAIMLMLSLTSCSWGNSASSVNVNNNPNKVNIVQLKEDGIIARDTQTAYIADVGKGQKGAFFSISIKFPVNGSGFQTKANNTNGVSAKTAADISYYLIYLIRNNSATGYPAGGDPLGSDAFAGPFTITNSGAATKTVTFANVPGSGSLSYYAAVRARNSDHADLIKFNNGSVTPWGSATQSAANGQVAVSSAAGIQVSSTFVVSSPTALSVTPNLLDAIGATIQTDVAPNPGTSALPEITLIGS